MQTKTIKKIIATKMDEWLDTITDVPLRKLVREELLVSGGCIVSMFLGEQVNDFDVYIKTPETAKRLADYYLKDYKELKAYMGKNKDKLIKEGTGDKKLDNAINYGTGHKNLFFNNLHPEQVKIWMDGMPGYKTANTNEEEGKYVPLFFSSNAISLSDSVQVVLRFTGDNVEIHKSFDFIHATNYFTFKEGLVTNKEALESLITKQLRYQGSLYPVTSIIRSKKFLLRGWSISAGEYFKIMYQISKLNLDNHAVLEEQLMGVDVAYFSALLEILRSPKYEGAEVTYEVIISLIDKVFNDSDIEI